MDWRDRDQAGQNRADLDWPSGEWTTAGRTKLNQDGTLWETDTPTGTVTVLREIYGTDFETARDTLCRRFRRFLNRGELQDASFLYATLRLCDELSPPPIAETAHAVDDPKTLGRTSKPQRDDGSHRALPVTPWQSMSCLG